MSNTTNENKTVQDTTTKETKKGKNVVQKDARTDEQKKIDALTRQGEGASKKGLKNSPNHNRFLGEVRALASEQKKELRAKALESVKQEVEAHKQRANTPGFDCFGIAENTKASKVASILFDYPQGIPMKNARDHVNTLSYQLTARYPDNNGKKWSETHYDAMNELHALGLIGRNDEVHPQVYFLLADAHAKKAKAKNKK